MLKTINLRDYKKEKNALKILKYMLDIKQSRSLSIFLIKFQTRETTVEIFSSTPE